MKRRITYINAVTIVAVVCLLFSHGAHAQLPSRVTGLQINSPFGMDIAGDPANKVNVGNDLGAKWVRGLGNDYFGDWNGDKNDVKNRITQMKDGGVMPLVSLFYPGEWIIPGKLGPPADMNAYVEKCWNMIDAAQSLDPYFEHWNEPWVNEWAWNGGSDEDYRQMIKRIWNRTKPTYPNIQLIGGGSTAFNRDVMWAKGSDIGYADGSICHAYGFPNGSLLGIVANQLELDKKYSKSQGMAGAFQTEFGTYPSMYAADKTMWVGRSVAPSYLLHMLAGFYAGRPVKCFWFSYGSDGEFSIDANDFAKDGYRTMTTILEGAKITADAFPKSKAINGIIFANVSSNDTRARATVWATATYLGSGAAARDPYNNSGDALTPSDEFSGSMSIASSNNMQAYDYLGNRINGLNNIPLYPAQVVYFLANMTSDEMKDAVTNATFDLKNEVKVTPMSLEGPVVAGRTLDFKVENQVNRLRSVNLSFTPPSGWSMDATSATFDLQPGEIRIVKFKINSGSASANNLYGFSFSYNSNGKTFNKNWTTQVAYAPRKTITVDGNLSDWGDVIAASMGSENYKLKLAWDENNFYFSAEISDDTHSPYPVFKPGDFAYFCNNRFDYVNRDGIILALDCMKDNPDDLLKGYANYEKACASDMDYQFFAQLAQGNVSEVIRYTAPGTNYQGYYPLNAVTNPPIQAINATPSGGTEGKVEFLRSGNKTIYEGAIAWNAIPQLRDSVMSLVANGFCDPNFAWKVIGGNAGDKFWTNESGQLEEGTYGFFPSWISGQLSNGGRVITRWAFTNGNGNYARPGSCQDVAITGFSGLTNTDIAINETKQIAFTVTPSNACKNLSYASSNTSIATVSSSGSLTGVAAGTATITLTANNGGLKATLNVTVSVPVAIDQRLALPQSPDTRLVQTRIIGKMLQITSAGSYHIKVYDIEGRLISQLNVTAPTAVDLATGITTGCTVVKITRPEGSTKTLRLVRATARNPAPLGE